MWIIAAAILLLSGSVSQAQVSPLQGTGFTQWFDNNGTVLTNGVLYSYAAGTTTQQATYTDSSGTTQNPNPIPLTTGGRVNVWLLTGSFYKLVLCSQNDGAFCAAGDILASADQIPGGSTSSSGVASSPFISASASPATTGILRLASSDSAPCWRNAAGSANLCWSKDANDLMTWAGGSLKLPEVSTPSCTGGFDVIWADNTAHRPKTCGNGGAPAQFVVAGGDINISDQVTQLHFGATGTPLSGTAPTPGQFLQWNGSAIIGSAPDTIVAAGSLSGGAGVCVAGVTNCPIFILPNAHTLTRVVTNMGTTPVGCSPNASWGIKDITSSTVLSSLTPTISGVLDSGPLSIAMTAGHQFGIGVTTAGAGCGTFGVAVVTATYQ